MRTLLVIIISVLVVATGCRTRRSFQDQARAKLSARVKHSNGPQFFSSITNLPASIRARLVNVADAGEAFSATCHISGGVPGSRFLAASKDGRLYTVAFEYGGVMHGWALSEYLLDDAGEIVSTRRVQPTD